MSQPINRESHLSSRGRGRRHGKADRQIRPADGFVVLAFAVARIVQPETCLLPETGLHRLLEPVTRTTGREPISFSKDTPWRRVRRQRRKVQRSSNQLLSITFFLPWTFLQDVGGPRCGASSAGFMDRTRGVFGCDKMCRDTPGRTRNVKENASATRHSLNSQALPPDNPLTDTPPPTHNSHNSQPTFISSLPTQQQQHSTHHLSWHPWTSTT